MSGSIYGKIFKVATFGESHGKAVGAVIDGCPAGLELNEEDIQKYLDRRKPGVSLYATTRKEEDLCEILSGVFEGKTTGTPIAVLTKNTDQNSKDYSDIKDFYRPSHADFTFEEKYGFRDYRGGGRSSGRETAARVCAGAIAAKILGNFGISVEAYTESVGEFAVPDSVEISERFLNPLVMPHKETYENAAKYIKTLMEQGDSAGGTAKCVVKGMPAGIGETVFDKLDGEIAKAVMSIGGVKAVEFGAGFGSALLKGSENNDSFCSENGKICKLTNNSGGTLGGMSDGSDIIFRVAIKPTPSIGKMQKSVDSKGENLCKTIKGRHDPLIIPRAIVVIEAMAAIAICDLMLQNMSSRMEYLQKIYL